MTMVSLVTGANRGIGLEVCRQLAAAGHDVVLTARNAEAAATAARPIGATPLLLDVTDPASVDQAAAALRDRYGRLDVLVNNAAISYDTWQRAITADLAVVRAAAETNPPTWAAPAADRSPDGAAGIVWAATLPDDGPTGGFFRDGRPLPW